METRQSYREALESVAQEVLAMGIQVEEALRRAVESLTSRDSELARGVITGDAAIDAMESAEDRMRSSPRSVHTSVELLLVARFLERVADHATKIGEWIAYGETARRTALNP